METPPPRHAGPPPADGRDALLRAIAAREARALALRAELRAERDRAHATARLHAAENQALRGVVGKAAAAVQERDALIGTLMASRSWRITAPLRALLRGLRGDPSPALPVAFVPDLPAATPLPAPSPPAGGARLPPALGPVEAADQRLALGHDLILPELAVAVVTPEATEQLRSSLAAAAERLPGWVRLFRSLEDAFAAGAELALAVPGDAALDVECLRRLAQAHLAAGGRAILEVAAFPDENPRPFDLLTFEIPWLSGHGWALPRAAWEALGGPDPALGHAEAGLDLGRRAQAAGFMLRYVPHALLLAPWLAAPDAAIAGARWE